jgi:hypothetical protein
MRNAAPEERRAGRPLALLNVRASVLVGMLKTKLPLPFEVRLRGKLVADPTAERVGPLVPEALARLALLTALAVAVKPRT